MRLGGGMLPSTRTVTAAHEYGYRSPARTASSQLYGSHSPLKELEAWMDADTERTSERARWRGGDASVLASPRSAGAPPSSPTPRHMAMRSTDSALSAAVRRYPTEVALSPATVRSSSHTAAALPAGLAVGRTLPRTRTSSAAADFGFGLGSPTALTVTAPEIAEMRRIVQRRSTPRATTSSSIRTTSGGALGLDGDPFANTAPAYVSPYRTASAGLVPSSSIQRSSSSAYESPLAFSSPRTSASPRDRLRDDLFAVSPALAGTEIAEAVRDYRRTGGVLNSASYAPAADKPLDMTSDALLERLKEEQWQREQKGHGAHTARIPRATRIAAEPSSCPVFCQRAVVPRVQAAHSAICRPASGRDQ